MDVLVDVVYEDRNFLIINKPAGLVCHPTKQGPLSSLIGRLRLYLGARAQPHFVNRLDRETGGLVVVATDRPQAVQLRQSWETRAVFKEYIAIVHGHVAENSSRIDAPLGKDENSRVVIKNCVRPDGADAITEIALLKRFSRSGRPFSLLRVIPLTGRKHQIRIHLSYFGHPIVGDKIYGADEDLYLALVENRLTEEQHKTLILSNHALHAARVGFIWESSHVEFRVDPAPWFSAFCPR